MKLTLHTVSTGSDPDRLLATLTLDATGHAVCDPPDALDGFLREGHLDLATRSLTQADGADFIRALAEYPLGGYVYARVLE
jgi:hypothetical protein